MKKYLFPLIFIVACQQSSKVFTPDKKLVETKDTKRKLTKKELDLLEILEQYYSSPKYNGYGIIDEFNCPTFEGCLNDSLVINDKGYLHYTGNNSNSFIDNYRFITPDGEQLDDNSNDDFSVIYSRGGQVSYTFEIQHYGGKWICIKKLNDYYGNFGLDIWVNNHKIYSETKTSPNLE